MAVRDIIKLPDPMLRQISKPLTHVSDDTRRILDDMLDTMYDAPGIGLAAVQIGIPLRLIVIDLAKDGEERTPIFLINPEIIWASE